MTLELFSFLMIAKLGFVAGSIARGIISAEAPRLIDRGKRRGAPLARIIDDGRDVARRVAPIMPPPQIPPPASTALPCGCARSHRIEETISDLEERIRALHPKLLPARPAPTSDPGPGEPRRM